MSLLAANTQPASSSTLSAAIQRNSSLPIQTNNTHRGLEETATADRFSGETPTACPAVVVVLARGVGGLFRLSRLSSWSDWESPLRFQWALINALPPPPRTPLGILFFQGNSLPRGVQKHPPLQEGRVEKQNCDLDDDEDNDTEPDGNDDPELAIDNDLTLDNLEDLEREDSKDTYTSDTFRQTLAKCHRIAMKLWKSPNSKAKFIEICEEAQCKKPHTIECDVPTRWNSTYLQLSSIVQCEEAIVLWQRDKQFGMPHNYHVQQEDFDLAANLVQLL
ncbi:hypothetical protein PGT21_004123 [Puccinia graminis f. sp. tritici]|uniref:Uncharacterized protein n=1 Tax=Puccinia graminis f. sp. tritici TaxID=56615 RepID=A0A5B0QHD5_PUCGR|nr:hypothetical protein PGT21_004123 [Puccinia graminis f. sp. tritici]